MLQRFGQPVWCKHVRDAPSGEFKRCDHRRCPQPYSHIEPAVKVDESKVHGQGLFATRHIKKGEVVCPYSGVCSNYCNPVNDSRFILRVKWQHPFTGEEQIWFLDSREINNAAGRWANDPRNSGRSANARYTDFPLLKHPLAQNRYYVNIRATRNIKIGEEILIAYGNQYTFD